MSQTGQETGCNPNHLIASCVFKSSVFLCSGLHHLCYLPPCCHSRHSHSHCCLWLSLATVLVVLSRHLVSAIIMARLLYKVHFHLLACVCSWIHLTHSTRSALQTVTSRSQPLDAFCLFISGP